jgi:hypothetical protein
MFSPVATFAEYERRVIIVELADVVEYEREVRASAALAAPVRFADPPGPDLLQSVAAKNASAVANLLAPGPRLRCVLKTAPSMDGDVRAVRCAAAAGGSSHSYIFGNRPGGAPNSRAAQSGQ